MQDITVGFCWCAYTKIASSEMTDSKVLRKYLTSPVRDFMQKLTVVFLWDSCWNRVLFSLGWPHPCSSASASLMFRWHGCTSVSSAWENHDAQSLSCPLPVWETVLSAVRYAGVSRLEPPRASHSFLSSMMGHLQVYYSACCSYMLGVFGMFYTCFCR